MDAKKNEKKLLVKASALSSLGSQRREANLKQIREEKRAKGLEARRNVAEVRIASERDEIRGITRRDYIAWLLFRALARGDFHHDFGENQPTRDKIVAADENRFFEIAKLVSKKGAVWLRTKFKENIGKNLYTLIADKINMILPVAPGAAPVGDPTVTAITGEGVSPGRFASEDQLLSRIGLDWVALKEEIKGMETGAPIKKDFAMNVISGGRPYEIRACPYRKSLDRTSPDYKINRAPIEALEIVTGGKTKFACIIDASGGFPFSDMRDKSLLTTDASTKEVYIIENIENGADSATKILPPPVRGTGQNNPPKIRFLTDKENTVNYPLWTNASDPKSNIYSNIFIILNRISDSTVEANLVVRDDKGKTIESFSIGDVSNTSNVKNATLYALAVFLEKGLVNEMLVYTLIKRMGDWCQALSLLDLDRVYSIYGDDHKLIGGQTGGAKEITLRQLQADDVAVGIVTNDRILLAFCLMLGLNVFYTSAMDIARLIYFKNTMDTPSPDAIAQRLDSVLAMTGDPATQVAKIDTHTARIIEARNKFITEKLNTAPIHDYIYYLRVILSNLARMRVDFETLKKQVNEYQAVVTNKDIDVLPRFTAANGLLSVLTKIDLDIKYNETVLQSIENQTYPGFMSDKIRLQALGRALERGGRIMKSVEVTEAKAILLETRNDIRQIMGKDPVKLLDGVNVIRRNFGAEPESKAEGNYNEILSVLPAIELLLPPVAGGARGQRGGGADADIIQARDTLMSQTIRVLPESADEVTSTVNIYKLGDTYYDSSLMGYTVADEYIITKADLPAFTRAFSNLVEDPEALVGGLPPLPEDVNVKAFLQYLCIRYLLLQVDLALNELNRLEEDTTSLLPAGEEAAEEVDGRLKPGTPIYSQHARLEAIGASINLALSKPTEDEFIRDTLSIFSNPPSSGGEATQALDSLREGFNNLRETIMSNIAAIEAPGEERAETAARETTLGDVVQTIIQDVRIVDPLVVRLGVTVPQQAKTLGDAFRATIAGLVVEREDPESPVVITTDQLVAIPGLTEALQATARSVTGNDNGKAIIETHIRSVQMGTDLAPAPRLAAVGPPPGVGGGLEGSNNTDSNVGLPSSSGVLPGGRRGLYAGLRKRSGAGGSSGVRE